MWKQSFRIRILMVLLARAGDAGLAISYCSNSFRFDQLCPDPRFGFREAGAGSGGLISISSINFPPDTNILLNNNDSSNYHRGRGGGSGYAFSSSGRSSASSMSTKDPTTNSCDFHKNGVETAVVTAVHVTENPWNFRHANQCNHIVKFNYDLFDQGSAGGIMGTETWKGSTGTGTKQGVCQNEIGFRRQGAQGEEHYNKKNQNVYDNDDDEIARKMNVYFWHNFTLYKHSAEFVDTITNYHWSKENVACVQEKRNVNYVQIVVVVSKGGRCENIVQQYKVDDKRSPWGCSGTSSMIPYPIQFCGSYDCSHTNGILTGLKLTPRRDSVSLENSKNTHAGHKGTLKFSHRPSKLSQGSSTSFATSSTHQQHRLDSGEGSNSYTDYGEGSAAGAHCVTEMTEATTTIATNSKQQHVATVSESSDDEEVESNPVDWMEAFFRFTFPTAGVILIFVVLYCLRSRSGREICRSRSHSFSNGHHEFYLNHHIQPSMYQGSSNSIDKNTLPI